MSGARTAGNVAGNCHASLNAKMRRVGALTRAVALVAPPALEKRGGISPRTMRAYVSVERGARGIPDSALRQTAEALEAHARETIAQAEALRTLVDDGS